jgi:hypothetical protein
MGNVARIMELSPDVAEKPPPLMAFMVDEVLFSQLTDATLVVSTVTE